jgi:hypothetical protein
MGMPDTVAAEICGVTREAQRQRLARARKTMRTIIADRCGLIDSANPCRCGRQIESSLATGILDPDNPSFATHPRTDGGPIAIDTIGVQAACPDLLA